MARAKQVRRNRGRRRQGTRWGRVVGFSALGLLVFLLVAVLGLYFWAKSYLKSEEFRAMVDVKTGGVMKGEGVFAPFEWTGASAYTESFVAKGYEDAFYSEARADGIRVDINFGASLRRGVWEVAKVTIERAEINIGDGRLPGFHPGVPDDPDSFLSSLLPMGFELVDSKVNRFFFNFQGMREVRLDDARIQAQPQDAGGLRITGTDGSLVISDLPEFKVKNFSARVDETALEIDDMALTFYKSAELVGRGEIRFRQRETPGQLKISYKVRNLNVKDVVGDDWMKKMSGNIRGEFSVAGDDTGYTHSGELELEQGVLEALPVLEKLATYTKTNGFRRMVLSEADMKYRYRDGKLMVDNIRLASNGLMRIEGKALIDNGEIEGEFYVGVPPSILQWLPGATKRVFTMERSEPEYAGYAWTTMKVNGPMDAPSENLSARLMEAAGLAILVDAPTEAVEAVTGDGAILENAPDVVKEGVKTGAGLLESGVNAAKGFLPMFGN